MPHFGAGLYMGAPIQTFQTNPENLPIESVANTDPYSVGKGPPATMWRLAPNGMWVSLPNQTYGFSSLAKMAAAVKVHNVINPLTGEQLYPPPANPVQVPKPQPAPGETAPQTSQAAPGAQQGLTAAQKAVMDVVEAAEPPGAPWPTWKKAAVIGGTVAGVAILGWGVYAAVKS